MHPGSETTSSRPRYPQIVTLLESRLLLAAVSLVMLACGAALALNFRGLTEWHTKRTIESMGWLEGVLRRVPRGASS